jgi:hypothetical protein
MQAAIIAHPALRYGESKEFKSSTEKIYQAPECSQAFDAILSRFDTLAAYSQNANIFQKWCLDTTRPLHIFNRRFVGPCISLL